MEKVLSLIFSNVSKVACEVSCRRFLMDKAPQSGRPVEVDSDQIETLIENNQRYATWEIDDTLKISKSMKLLVKMKMCLSSYRKKTK